MKIQKTFLMASIFMALTTFNHVTYAETATEFKAKLLKKAGPLGPFAKSEDFPKSYFLITKNLPFMVSLVLVHPMKQKLGLSQEQIEKIKIIKKTTVPIVVTESKKIKQQEIILANKFIAGATIVEMEKMVDNIAILRTNLTKKHLVCIDEVRAILTPEQFKIMIGYAGNRPTKK